MHTKVGDIDYHQQQILSLSKKAQRQNVDILLFPELCLSGYGAEDYFFYDGFISRVLDALITLADKLPSEMLVMIGLPIKHHDGKLYNAATVIFGGELKGIVCKRVLANSGIHYESRWFTPWPYGREETIQLAGKTIPIGDINIELSGFKIGVEICEDAWGSARPLVNDNSFDFILNLSASHYALGKQFIRRQLVVDSSKAISGVYAYSNLIGCEAGRIIYDGASFIAQDGQLMAESERLVFTDSSLLTASLRVTPKQSKVSASIHLKKRFSQEIVKASIAAKISDERELILAISRGLWDWLLKTKTTGFVVSLSGGADSALCASCVAISQFIALKTLGIEHYARELKNIGIMIDVSKHQTASQTIKEQVMPALLTTAYQGTTNSSQQTRSYAANLATVLGAKHYAWDVNRMIDEYQQTIEQAINSKLSWENDDISLQNIQARSRSPAIWMLANLENKLLIATSNLSEAVVGYCTMDGDTSGVLAPIGGLAKTKVLALLRYLGEKGFCFQDETFLLQPLKLISQQAPSAELRPQAQSDEQDLMPYDVLDSIRALSQVEFLEGNLLLDKLCGVYQQTFSREQLEEWYQRYQVLASRSQWKRERLAPAFHLEEDSACAKTYRRWPILT